MIKFPNTSSLGIIYSFQSYSFLSILPLYYFTIRNQNQNLQYLFCGNLHFILSLNYWEIFYNPSFIKLPALSFLVETRILVSKFTANYGRKKIQYLSIHPCRGNSQSYFYGSPKQPFYFEYINLEFLCPPRRYYSHDCLSVCAL